MQQRRTPRSRRAADAPPPGFAGRPLPAQRRAIARDRRHLDDTGGGGRVSGVLLIFAVALLVVTHGLYQVTAPEPSGRVLRAILPPLTDLDQSLSANLDSVREVAAGLPSGGELTVPGLPVPVTLGKDEALSGDSAALRPLILMRMSTTAYRQGSAAFRAPDAKPSSPALFSSQWTLQRTLNLLTADQHRSLKTPRLFAALLTLLLAGLTIALLEGPAKLLGPGASVVAGAVLAAAAAAAARLLGLLFFGGQDVVDGVVRRVLRDGANTVLVVAVVFAAFGLALTALGMLVRRLDQAEPAPVAGRGRAAP